MPYDNKTNFREKLIDIINRQILMWTHIALVANFFTFNLFIYAAMWKGAIFLPFVLAGIAFGVLSFCIQVKTTKLEYLCGKLYTCDDLQDADLELCTTLSATLYTLFSLRTVLFVAALIFMLMAAN
jgi:hypothetical protein